MYNDYFGFRETPFNVTPNPKYFYNNPTYQEAYASLLYGVRERKGFIVLTGEVGTGKTTLLRKLMDSPEENVKTVFFYNTTLGFEELISYACDELGLSVKGAGRLQKIRALNEFLIAQSQSGGTVVLLVDEAQNLTDDVLENLRLLSNLETSSEKLLQIVLVGQTELNAKLSQPQLRQVRQRVALHCRLDRLKDREVGPFINYRLRMAGYEGEDIFIDDAVREVAFYSKGIPRLINIICDNALLIGYATSVRTISGDIIREVAGDLQLDDSDRRVVDDGSFAARAVSINGKTENEEQGDTEEKPVPRQALKLNMKAVWIGSLAASILLVFAIGGMAFYHAGFDAWLSDVVFGQLKQPNIPPPQRPALSEKSIGRSTSDNSPDAGETKPGPEAVASPSDAVGSPQKAQSASTVNSTQVALNMGESVDEPMSRSVVVQRGNTISRIAGQIYGTDKMFLGMDLLQEYNPRIEDLNWVLEGQQLSLPPLSRKTLMRRQPDNSYRIVLGAFVNSEDAENLGRIVRLKGYATRTTPRKISKRIILYRLEIEGLKSLDAANEAWSVATENRWISDGLLPREDEAARSVKFSRSK